MSYTAEFIDEINVLTLFDVSNHQEGIKVHTSAENNAIEATKRLYSKGLVTQEDGGYLTDIGLEAAECAQLLLSLIKAD